MDIGQQQLEKARIYAYLSYLAFVMPILGLIFSAISISILHRVTIDPSDQDYADERDRIYRHAIATRWISIAIIAAIGLYLAIEVTIALNALQQNTAPVQIHSSFYN
jgi:hypothetical protein